jgi:hypothetical protein
MSGAIPPLSQYTFMAPRCLLNESKQLNTYDGQMRVFLTLFLVFYRTELDEPITNPILPLRASLLCFMARFKFVIWVKGYTWHTFRLLPVDYIFLGP